MKNKKKKIEIISGRLVRRPKMRVNQDKEKFYSFKLYQEIPKGLHNSYINILISDKYAKEIQEIGRHEKLRIIGCRNKYSYFDSGGNQQFFEYYEALKPIEKIWQTRHGRRFSKINTFTNIFKEKEIINGFLAEQVKKETKYNSTIYSFVIGIKNHFCDIDYKTIHADESYKKKLDKINLSDKIEVHSSLVHYQYIDREGDEQVVKYHKALDIKKIPNRKTSLEGRIIGDIDTFRYENGFSYYFFIVDKDSNIYGVKSGSKFLNKNELPQDKDVVKITGYLRKEKFKKEIILCDKVKFKIKNNIRIEEEKNLKANKIKL